jgi:hypothetical protein
VPRLQACSAGLDGTQKGCVLQPGACGPAKPDPRPLLEKSAAVPGCASYAAPAFVERLRHHKVQPAASH